MLLSGILDPLYNMLLLAVWSVGLGVATRRAVAHSSLLPAALPAAVATIAALLLAALLQRDLFHLTRLGAWAIFLHGPLILLGTACLVRARSRALAGICLASALGLLAIAFDAFLIEPHWIEVREVRLQNPKIERPITIAVVADLQAERVGEYERGVLERVMQRKPDLILLPGDYIQEYRSVRRAAEVSRLRGILEALEFGAPLGAWAVEGNVDPQDWPSLFVGTGVQPLPASTAKDLPGMRLSALDLRSSYDRDIRIEAVDEFHVVLGHAPDFALGDVRADLLIAGHTHGGQVRLPLLGPLLTLSAVPRSWAAGVTRLDNERTLIVSRGIGMERGRAPRLRFLCRPELVFVEVYPE